MDTAFSLIAIFLPGSDFAPDFCHLIDPAVQTLPIQDQNCPANEIEILRNTNRKSV